jgi:hypothetical protein
LGKRNTAERHILFIIRYITWIASVPSLYHFISHYTYNLNNTMDPYHEQTPNLGSMFVPFENGLFLSHNLIIEETNIFKGFLRQFNLLLQRF